jgi:tRNA threonylcarbamoyladenosine biosynthesis protein TsaB
VGLILHIETATRICSVAVSTGEEILAHITEKADNYTHSERLHVLADEVLKCTGNHFGCLTHIAVSNGPGSYTGLRIGLSAAKGWCFALDIPLIAVDTLHSLAHGLPESLKGTNGFVLPMIDARRMEVYTAMFDTFGNRITKDIAQILDKDTYTDIEPQTTMHFFGDGSVKFKEVCNRKNVVFHDLECDARYQLSVVRKKIEEGNYSNLSISEPYYLKDFTTTQQKRGMKTE